MRVARRRGNPEADIQRPIVKDLRRLLLPPFYVHHSANEVRGGGEEARKRQGILLGMGIQKGFSDLLVAQRLPTWDRPLLLYMEVKTATGQLTEAEEEFRDLVELMGWPFVIVRSSADALDAVIAHGFATRVKGGL